MNNNNTANNTANNTVVTHNGLFHGDEVAAVALLRLLHPNLTTVRTRDRMILSAALKDPDVWVLDVGGDFAPEKRNFDHHQDREAQRATAGLVLEHLQGAPTSLWEASSMGVALGVSPLDAKRVSLDTLEPFVREVDRWDLGDHSRGPVSLSRMISTFNPPASRQGDADTAFEAAVSFTVGIFSRAVKEALVAFHLRSLAEASVRECAGERMLVLKEAMPPFVWKGLAEDGGFQVAIFPDIRSGWRVYPLQGGKFHPEFTPSGEVAEDLIFVHQAGFIAGTKSREGAALLAKEYLLSGGR